MGNSESVNGIIKEVNEENNRQTKAADFTDNTDNIKKSAGI